VSGFRSKESEKSPSSDVGRPKFNAENSNPIRSGDSVYWLLTPHSCSSKMKVHPEMLMKTKRRQNKLGKETGLVPGIGGWRWRIQNSRFKDVARKRHMTEYPQKYLKIMTRVILNSIFERQNPVGGQGTAAKCGMTQQI
jgi:hypothetical protein